MSSKHLSKRAKWQALSTVRDDAEFKVRFGSDELAKFTVPTRQVRDGTERSGNAESTEELRRNEGSYQNLLRSGYFVDAGYLRLKSDYHLRAMAARNDGDEPEALRCMRLARACADGYEQCLKYLGDDGELLLQNGKRLEAPLTSELSPGEHDAWPNLVDFERGF